MKRYGYLDSPSFHEERWLWQSPTRGHHRDKDDSIAPKEAQGRQLSKDPDPMRTAANTIQQAIFKANTEALYRGRPAWSDLMAPISSLSSSGVFLDWLEWLTARN